jgi:hypothetical protein
VLVLVLLLLLLLVFCRFTAPPPTTGRSHWVVFSL